MGDVVDFVAAKEEREPHMSGKARCLACKHEWEAVAPLGTIWLDCPECTLERGRFIGPCERDGSFWRCNCGNHLFEITPEGVYCPNCGVWQNLEF